MWAAAKTFGIPYRTLKRRTTHHNLVKGALGPRGSLGPEHERSLVAYIQQLGGVGVTRLLAYTFAETNNIAHRFSKERELAGHDWMKLFVRRLARLSIRKAEGISIAPGMRMCREEVNVFFKLLQTVYQEIGIVNHPAKIYNIDESGLQLNNTAQKVIAAIVARDVHRVTSVARDVHRVTSVARDVHRVTSVARDVHRVTSVARDVHRVTSVARDVHRVTSVARDVHHRVTSVARDVHRVTSAEKGETVNVIACCNAEGKFLPPYCVFKGKGKRDEFGRGMPPGSRVVMGEQSAYVNMDLFMGWMRDHFVPWIENGKVLLILDGHSSHCSDVAVRDYAHANDIVFMCLSSHTTQYLQPLDRSLFKPLKTYWQPGFTVTLEND